MDEDAIAAVVKEIEEEKALGRVSAVQVFKSILNQPALVSISSASATAVESTDGYSSFTVNMPRPILSVSELELLTANIPLCTQNIPDTACVFWYYRLSLYSGLYPNPNNLFWVRLLPSYYKPEFIRNFADYGYNKTFDGYPNVATQLALATTNDLALQNFTDSTAGPPYYRIQYLPLNEVKITYDSSINKFQFAGNFGLPQDELDPDLIPDSYNVATTYAEGDIVKDTNYFQGWGYLVYKSLTAGNVGHPLPVYPADATAYWERDYNLEGVAEYSPYTPYLVGQFVAYNDTLYQCIQNSFANLPTVTTYWKANPVNTPLYRYMVTGPADPNVAFMQAEGRRGWSQYALYEGGDNVLYNGVVYQALWQVGGVRWFPTSTSTNVYSPATAYATGEYVFYSGNYFTCIVATTGNAPPASASSNTWWAIWQQSRVFEPFPVPNAADNSYSAGRSYVVGDYVVYSGKWYINILPSKGNAPTGAYTNNTWWNFIEYDVARPNGGSVSPANLSYQVGDIVTYVGYSYVPFWKCIKANPPAGSLSGGGLNVRFGLNEYWQPCYWTTGAAEIRVPYVGLAKISSQFDMLDDLEGAIQYPFPEGIPPQPYAGTPQRLLNSILGFTWNGKFTPQMFSVIYEGVAISGSTTVTQLFNRLRPIPQYTSYELTGVSAAGSVVYDPTFTANGYGNLVYSSIINIYATITGGSSLDTIRNTNLIGTLPMSAGNLGIAFAANFIRCSLEAQEADVYSITFSFTDEFGEPYPLTNNAVVTMTLKMGYRSKVDGKNGGDV
jgi:hypothetical protein